MQNKKGDIKFFLHIWKYFFNFVPTKEHTFNT